MYFSEHKCVIQQRAIEPAPAKVMAPSRCVQVVDVLRDTRSSTLFPLVFYIKLRHKTKTRYRWKYHLSYC